MLTDLLFLPILFFIGIITSYEDFKYGLIKNKWIILGVFWFFAVCLGLILAKCLSVLGLVDSKINVDFVYIKDVLINSLISLLVGYFLWKAKLWSSGDAKLFGVLALLLPLKYYSNGYLFLFPSFAIMVNIFIPIFIFLMLCSFLFIGKNILGGKIKKDSVAEKSSDNKKREKKSFLSVIFVMTIFFFLIQFIRIGLSNFIPIDPAVFNILTMMLLFFLSKYLFAFFKKPLVFKLAVASLIIIFSWNFYYSFEETLDEFILSLKMLFVFIVLLGIVRQMVDFYSESVAKKKIPFAFWMMIGVVLTIIFKAPLLSLFLPNPATG